MNDYAYCPMCGERIESWSGFWPDYAFQVRRASVNCIECGFKADLIVNTGKSNVPKVNFELRDND